MSTKNKSRQSEDRFNMLLKASEDMITVHEPNGKYIYYNGPTCYAITPEDIEGKMPNDLFDKDVSNTLMNAFKKVNKTGKSETIEVLLDWLGEKRWFSEYIYPVNNADGEIVEIVKVCRDIHQRKLAEQEIENKNKALLESEKAHRDVLEASSDLISVVDKNGKIIFINHASKKFYGLLPKECCGKSIFDFTHPEDKEYTQTKFVEWGNSKKNNFYFKNRQTTAFGKTLVTEWSINIERKGREIIKITSIIRDITEQNITRQKLINAKEYATEQKQASQYARSLIEASLDPLVTISAEGKITDVNEALEKVTGISRKKLIGTEFSNYFTDPKKAQEGYLQVFDQGFVTDYPLTIKNKNGNLTDVLYNASVYKDDKGNFLGVFAAARDVTQLNAQNIERERKSIEIANLKVELERTIVCLNESAIVSESDANFNIVFVNDKFCEISGYKREELLGVNHRILKSGKQPDALHMDMMKTIRAGEVFKGNLLNKKKGGKEFYWVEATIMPFKDLDGKLIKCVSIQFDITDQVERKDALIKHAEALRVSEEDLQNINLELEVRSAKDLIASENRFRSLFENATQCMLVVNMKSQKIINANKSAIALFKYSKDDLFKMGPRELSPEWQPDGIASDTQIRADIEKLQKEKKVSREWAFNDAHGDDIQAELSINLLSETDISQVVVNIIDVTEKNRIKDELAYQNEEKDRHAAELAVANKELVFQNEENTKRTAELEEFTYVASHDLQEPVRTISSFVNLFRENYADKLDDEAKQYLDFMDGASQRSQQLIVDLLDYSKLDENRETEQVNLNQVLESVLVDLTGRIKESGALVTVDKLPTIEGQMTNLRLLFQNLISNAIKFHKKDILPKVYISFTTVDNEYVFSISDNGIGIEEKYMDRIFVIFKRLHGKSDYEGTGIGLAHCKKIVELHNGRISVESELEKGSTFLIAIPIEVEI